MKFYKRWLGSYKTKTTRLNMLQHGAYNLMLDEYYSSEENLPLDRDELYELVKAKTEPEKDAVEIVLKKYWIETPDGYVQEKADEVIEDYYKHMRDKEVLSERGRKGANSRWDKYREQQQADAQAMLKHKHEQWQDTDTDTDNKIIDKDSIKNNKTLVEQDAQPVSAFQSIKEVFLHWQTVLDHPKAKLTNERSQLIKRKLKDYSVDDLKKAITGCSLTPHNMGDNDRSAVYDDIELILRNAGNIERFMANADSPPKPSGKRGALETTVSNMRSLIEAGELK